MSRLKGLFAYVLIGGAIFLTIPFVVNIFGKMNPATFLDGSMILDSKDHMYVECLTFTSDREMRIEVDASQEIFLSVYKGVNLAPTRGADAMGFSLQNFACMMDTSDCSESAMREFAEKYSIGATYYPRTLGQSLKVSVPEDKEVCLAYIINKAGSTTIKHKVTTVPE